MLVVCASRGGTCHTGWPRCLGHRQGWRYLSVLLLGLSFGGCGGGGSQPSGGGPGPQSQPAIVFQSFAALDGSDAATNSSNPAENIWLVSADGTVARPVTRLTGLGTRNEDPVWSPDGVKIAFDDGGDIWSVNIDGSGATALTDVLKVSPGSSIALAIEPAWSPDGRKLAAAVRFGLIEVFNFAVLSADGSNFAVLTSFSDNGAGTFNDAGSDWSPDGSKLLFDAPGDSAVPSSVAPNVWVMNADGSGLTSLTNLTTLGAACFQASWSPDGSKVVFASSRALDGSDAANANSTFNIWVMNADGSSAKPLTKFTANGANNTAPAWSPDGSKLAFESAGALNGSDAANANLTVNIWVVNADGTGAIPLTKLTGAGASSHVPNWSPGGSKLTFASMRAVDGRDLSNAASNIWEMNADSSGVIPLTKNTAKGADSLNPRWRP
jgi:Tol biopolymer transport system component